MAAPVEAAVGFLVKWFRRDLWEGAKAWGSGKRNSSWQQRKRLRRGLQAAASPSNEGHSSHEKMLEAFKKGLHYSSKIFV